MSVQSASGAYLHAQQRVFTSSVDSDANTRPIVELASGVMGDGYPQIADRALSLEEAGIVKRGSNSWMWATIALAAAIVAVAVVVGLVACQKNRVRASIAGEYLYDLTGDAS